MQNYFLPALLLLLSTKAEASFQPRLDDLDEIPLHVALVNQTGDNYAAAVAEARRFAIGTPLTLDLDDGVWDVPDHGTVRWRSRVLSVGAVSLNLEFAGFHMPSGGSLWIYDPQGALIQGPYKQEHADDEGRLWTAVVMGDEIVIEARLPEASRDGLKLELAQVNHGFRHFGPASTAAKSGACNIDVICTLGDAWRDEIRSVGTYSLGGERFCTGQLVNNQRQDDRPLFLTANHCQIRAGNASSVVVYWNYQTSVCQGAPNGSLNQNQSGASLLARDERSDFTLLLLAASPDPAFGVHYAGWDVTGTAPQFGVSIHHPSGDEKRISEFTAPATAVNGQCIAGTGVNCVGGFVVDAWRVHWTQGTTEPGSSGAGLWNEEQRIVGVLSGGSAACDDPQTSEDEQKLPDFYGRLASAWTANASASGQLKAHLDPDNTGIPKLNGKNPGTSPTPTPNPTATPSPTAPPADSNSGGGSFGLSLLGLLLSLGLLRRRMR
jgi:lysyl endopeptidase